MTRRPLITTRTVIRHYYRGKGYNSDVGVPTEVAGWSPL